MMKMPKLWAILSYFILWCLVDVRAASNFNPEYFTRHLLWQMNPLCYFQTKVWKCGRVFSATSKKSSWTYADSTYSMYSMFFLWFVLFLLNLIIYLPNECQLTLTFLTPFIYLPQIIILDKDVWSFSANIVFQEILGSQIHWGSWGSSGLITLKDLNRINPHQIHGSQRLAFKSQGSRSKHLHTLVYIFLLSLNLKYKCT